MKTILPLFILTLLTSCGMKKEYNRSLSVAPEVQPYVSTFESRYKVKIIDLKVAFAEMSSATGAYCQKSTKTENKLTKTVITETPEVYVNAQMWPSLSFSQKEELVFHELGHCILNRDHKNDRIPVTFYNLNLASSWSTTIQSSIMNAYIFSNGETSLIGYEGEFYDYYMAELFGQPESSYAGYAFSDASYNMAITLNPNPVLVVDEKQPYVAKEELDEGCVHNLGHIHVDSNGNEIEETETVENN